GRVALHEGDHLAQREAAGVEIAPVGRRQPLEGLPGAAAALLQPIGFIGLQKALQGPRVEPGAAQRHLVRGVHGAIASKSVGRLPALVARRSSPAGCRRGPYASARTHSYPSSSTWSASSGPPDRTIRPSTMMWTKSGRT